MMGHFHIYSANTNDGNVAGGSGQPVASNTENVA